MFCRVLRPPGGGSSNLFGGYEDDAAASRRPNKMASKVFAPAEEPQSVPRRSNPPGQTSLSGLMNVLRQASLNINQCPGCENRYHCDNFSINTSTVLCLRRLHPSCVVKFASVVRK